MRNYVRRPTDSKYGSDSYPHQSDSLPHSQDALCVERSKSDLNSNKRIVKKGSAKRIYIYLSGVMKTVLELNQVFFFFLLFTLDICLFLFFGLSL